MRLELNDKFKRKHTILNHLLAFYSLLNSDDCNVRTFEGQTPLLLACESLDKRRSMVTDVRKVIRCLLKRDDVDVNIGDRAFSWRLLFDE